MADIIPTRKSGRKRERSKKYTDDLYETLNLEISDGDDLIPSRRPGEDAQDDEDFDADQVFEEPDLSVEENLSVAEASEGSPIATPGESERDEMSDDQLSEEAGKPKRKKKWKPPPEVHFRGLAERRNEIAHGSEGGFIDSVIGSAKADVATYLKARDMWANNISLPSKHIGGRDSGGMRHPFNHTPKQREIEATVGWNWYYLEGGKVSFQQRQTTRVLSAEESARYVPKLADSSHGVLMGPYGKQKLFSLTFLQCLNIEDAWSQARAAKPTPSGFTPLPQTPSKRQDGWVLNVGSSVQCLDWAPNHTNTQYVAISTLQAKKMPQQGFSNTAPAYTPQPGPSSIQIWAVAKSDIEGEDAYLPLQLSLVICTEWGHATQLKWCPMPRVAQDNEAESRIFLGLLASVWADGCARVLDVYLEAQKDDGTQYGMWYGNGFCDRY
jgi:transcription factor C subunit 6